MELRLSQSGIRILGRDSTFRDPESGFRDGTPSFAIRNQDSGEELRISRSGPLCLLLYSNFTGKTKHVEHACAKIIFFQTFPSSVTAEAQPPDPNTSSAVSRGLGQRLVWGGVSMSIHALQCYNYYLKWSVVLRLVAIKLIAICMRCTKKLKGILATDLIFYT